MTKLVGADTLATKICEAMKIDPASVARVVIDLQAGDVGWVYVQMLGDESLLDIDFGAHFEVKR